MNFVGCVMHQSIDDWITFWNGFQKKRFPEIIVILRDLQFQEYPNNKYANWWISSSRDIGICFYIFCVAKSGPDTDTIKTIWDFNSQHIQQQLCGDACFANNNWNHCKSMIACRLDTSINWLDILSFRLNSHAVILSFPRHKILGFIFFLFFSLVPFRSRLLFCTY